MTKKELAIAYHDKKFNCAQAVACAFAKEVGADEKTLFRAAEGLGLGMGGMEGTCGALSGAILLAGMKNPAPRLPPTSFPSRWLPASSRKQAALSARN